MYKSDATLSWDMGSAILGLVICHYSPQQSESVMQFLDQIVILCCLTP